MEQVTHPPGTFCWPELATTDYEGAKSFYSELMDWRIQDDSLPGGALYGMVLKEGGYVGGFSSSTGR